jgi:hypothetical protein
VDDVRRGMELNSLQESLDAAIENHLVIYMHTEGDAGRAVPVQGRDTS